MLSTLVRNSYPNICLDIIIGFTLSYCPDSSTRVSHMGKNSCHVHWGHVPEIFLISHPRYMHFTKSQRRQRRDTSDHLRRSSIFSDVGPFAGIRRFYSKNSDTGTDTDVDKKKSLRKKENIIRYLQSYSLKMRCVLIFSSSRIIRARKSENVASQMD